MNDGDPWEEQVMELQSNLEREEQQQQSRYKMSWSLLDVMFIQLFYMLKRPAITQHTKIHTSKQRRSQDSQLTRTSNSGTEVSKGRLVTGQQTCLCLRLLRSAPGCCRWDCHSRRPAQGPHKAVRWQDRPGSPCAGRAEQAPHRPATPPREQWNQKGNSNTGVQNHSRYIRRNKVAGVPAGQGKVRQERNLQYGKSLNIKKVFSPYIRPQAIPTVSEDFNILE